MIRKAAIILPALAFPAGAFELLQPVDCTLGESCYIQQFFDHDPGSGAFDFTCGSLSYDGHDGTDFAVATRAAMEAGILVLAAAPGRVRALRDGIADFAPATAGLECGNGVVLDHGQGWETQYCHLKQGSITVAEGDVLPAGVAFGLVGQSGNADFPHLHLSVRRNGVKLDPFAPEASACGSAGDDLWEGEMPVAAGGLLDVGIATTVPEFQAIKAGLPSPDLPAAAPALVVWAYTFGPRAGDELTLTLSGPNGTVISSRLPVEKTQAQAFRAIGRKLTTVGWPSGTYEGSAILTRNGIELDRMQVSISVLP